MNVLIYIEVSDRLEVEGTPGLHASLQFKLEDSDQVASVTGTTVLNDAGAFESVVIIDCGLRVDDALISCLLRAAFRACSSAIIANHAVTAGFSWQPLRSWLGHHLPEIRPSLLVSPIWVSLQRGNDAATS